MTSSPEKNQNITSKGILASVQNYYHAYRQWKKGRGRRKKAEKQAQKMRSFYSQFVQSGSEKDK